jgi:hypothetical protein
MNDFLLYMEYKRYCVVNEIVIMPFVEWRAIQQYLFAQLG